MDLISKQKEPFANLHVKPGKWIPQKRLGKDCYKCSICGYDWKIYPVESFKFCPACGYPMAGSTAEAEED